MKFTQFITLIVVIFVLILCHIASSNAQEQHQIAVQLLLGKWTGEIEGVVQGCLPCWYQVPKSKHTCPKDPQWHPFRIKLIGNRSEADMTIKAKYPPVSFQARGSVGVIAPGVIGIMINVGDPVAIPTEALGLVTVLYNGGFRISEASNKTVKLVFGAFDKPKDMKATAELYRVELLKKSFPKDIKPNEPIKTDKETQLEIAMPSKDVIKLAQNTEAVIKSGNLIGVLKGRIHNIIKTLKSKTKFEVNTPTAIIGKRNRVRD